MASNNDGYWSRSWALLTRDKGWIKPLLVLSAAQLVPVAGQLGASGYALEWGRLTAWGVDSAPKQKGVKVGECIKSGARALVVALGYALVFALVRGLLRRILGEALSDILGAALTVAFSVLVSVAMLRATVYQSIGAGYEVGRIWDMIKRDYQGLLRIMGMLLLVSLAIGVAVGILVSGVMLAHMGELIRLVVDMESSASASDMEMAIRVMNWLGSMLPLLLVVAYVVGVLAAGANLLEKVAVGLWMRQFDVQRWGESSDPLPGTQPGYAAGGYGYGAQGGYGQANQPGATYEAPAAAQSGLSNAYDAVDGSYSAPIAPVPGAMQPADDRVVQSVPLSYGEPTPEQVTASQGFDASQFAGIPQVVTPAQEPQSTEIPQAESVPTFVLDGAAEPAGAASVDAESTVATFTLDDAAPTEPATFGLDEAAAPEPEVFTLDEVMPELSSNPAPFTLDDAAVDAPAEPAAFSLDDVAAASAEPAAFSLDAVAAASAEPTAFTLDDAIAQSRAIVDADLTEPVELPRTAIPTPPVSAEVVEPEAPVADAADGTTRDEMEPLGTDGPVLEQPTDEPAAPEPSDEDEPEAQPTDSPEA